MAQPEPLYVNDVKACVDAILEKVGREVIIGMPLALGKSYSVANELYERAKKNPEMRLTIITALALEKPVATSELERRMLDPIVERVWEGVPDFSYMKDLRRGALPENVTVREFFCKAGGYVKVPAAQQEYVSSNYTHVVRDLEVNAINVFCQTVAKGRDGENTVFSDSCNADLGQELVDYFTRERAAGRNVVHVGHINRHLPFMYGDAVHPAGVFDILLEGEDLHFPLFSVPKAAVATADHMIGLYVSSLIKDCGTLQIGIGALGDAIADKLILRNGENAVYRRLLQDAGIEAHYGPLVDKVGGREPFSEGLYGATEMLVEVFIELYKAGIIKRKVYGDIGIQEAVNAGDLTEEITENAVEKLLSSPPYWPVLTQDGFENLTRFGVFREDLTYEDFLISNHTATWSADLRDPVNRQKLAAECRGSRLKNGVLLHGGFFIGSNGFYSDLRNMTEEERQQFEMTGVAVVNQLYGDEALRSLQRKNGRFVNTGMMLSLLGNICSDGLADGTVISGVGGQYNFVSMAHALEDGRLIMMIRSTGMRKGKTVSNIVFNYGHTTIPRHLRDIVVTEYGIADLRGRSDKDVIAAILNITDSRFQIPLLEQAKAAGKISQSYEIPMAFRENRPERLEALAAKYRAEGGFQSFPFGSEFTKEEQVLGRALRGLKANIATNKAGVIGGILGRFLKTPPEEALPYLSRMGLSAPGSTKEKLLRAVVTHALAAAGALD